MGGSRFNNVQQHLTGLTADSVTDHKIQTFGQVNNHTKVREDSFEYSSIERICVADYEDELQLFLEEVSNVVVKDRTSEPTAGEQANPVNVEDGMAISIKREVLRAEIRTIANQLREQQHPAHAVTSSSQRATMISIKRKVKELTDDVERIRREKKALEIDIRDLHEELLAKSSMLSELQSEIRTSKSQTGELESKLELSQHTSNALSIDRRRLERYVSNLRAEIIDYQNVASESELHEKQAQRYISELESRLFEMRKVESALTLRVNELVQIQREQQNKLKRAIESKDLNGAMRSLTNMSARASQVTRKIALLLKRRGDSSENLDDSRDPPIPATTIHQGQSEGEEDSAEELNIVSTSTRDSGTAKHGDQSSATAATAIRTNIFFRTSRLITSRKSSLEGSGKEARDSKSFMSRTNRQQEYEATILRSQQEAERNCEVLQEVVEAKNSEIRRLEGELKAAMDIAAKLEMDKLAETTLHRKENRNLRVEEQSKVSKMRDQKQKNRNQSLFDWQRFEHDGNVKDD